MLQTIHAVDINKLRMFQRLYRNTMYAKEDMDSEIDKMSKQEVEDKLKDLRHIMHNPEQLSVYIFADVIISIQESPNAMWNIIKSRLDTSYSKTRQHGPTFLVYTLLDACVDDLTPMVHAFGAKLLLLDRLLHLDSRKFDCKKLHHCLKQISGLKRMCKPLNEVVTQLSESNGSEFQGEILRYFRDVHDHILSVEEDCEKHLETCRSLIDSYHNIRSQKQDQVSFTLTLIAAIFLPAQFLTGLYGMNFENMPELKTFGGYYVWWAFVLLTMISTIWYFRHKMWL
jgi:magnesium/cobalt transport protein CorA